MSSLLKHELPNGVRVLMEPLPHVRSASVGLWLEFGSRDEPVEMGGICHFIEHMFFKGAGKRDAFELADEMNRLGGYFNAFTSQEAICVHARLVDSKIERGFNLLSDIMIGATFPEDEIVRERNVILEEIKMIEDTPDEYVGDLFHMSLWGDHPIGRPIIGNPDTISSFDRNLLIEFMQHEFSPERLIVAAAGGFDPDTFLKQSERLLGRLARNAPPQRYNGLPKPVYTPQRLEKDIEQVQFCIGSLAPERAAEDRFQYALLNTILGGGTSSRVFKEVRERRGLAYSIGSFLASYRDTGCIGIVGGTSPDQLDEVVEICVDEIQDLYRNGCKPDELEMAREQAITSILFALESTGARMTRLAEQEMYYGRFFEEEEIIRRVEAVTEDDIRDAAARSFENAQAAVACIEPIGSQGIALRAF